MLRVGLLGAPMGDVGNGARLAIDQINGAGGFAGQDGTTYRFELITLPDAATEGSLGSDVSKLLEREGLVAILGPDDDEVLSPDNIDTLTETELPILTAVTLDRLTEDDDTNSFFRIRAPEYVYNWAAVTVLVDDLGAESFALVQTDIASTLALASFEDALGEMGITPVQTIQDPDNARLDEHAATISALAPDVVAFWGAMEDAASLLRQLRDEGGMAASSTVTRTRLLARARSGGLGAGHRRDEQLCTATARALADFPARLHPGVQRTADGAAVAGYDAIWYLRSTVINFGASPEQIRDGLLNGNPVTLVQGAFHRSNSERRPNPHLDRLRAWSVWRTGRAGAL